MAKSVKGAKPSPDVLLKTPTGIRGLDEISGGGLPNGRTTLVCGGTGCGKTFLAMEFIVRGATQYDEPGVFMSFEEKNKDLTKNFVSLGFDLNDLEAGKKLVIDYVHIDRSEIEENGSYNLAGLFTRLGHAIDSIGAKRVVLDTPEALFSGFDNETVLRAELKRLFDFLTDQGVTAIITGVPGATTLTRHGLEEYVADCVIALEHSVHQQIATRRLRIIKYRGSFHGTNEYPFLIDERGLSVMPVVSLGLEDMAPSDWISTGSPRLDTMLSGKGYFRGSSILVTGTAGTGKSSIAALFIDAACKRGERCIYFAFEESQNQIIRNMRSIGINLEQWVKKDLLRFQTSTPMLYGLEMHLVTMHKSIEDFKPVIAVVDPISNLVDTATEGEVKSMFSRLIIYLKTKQITTFCTDLTSPGVLGSNNLEQTGMGVSSLMDTWLLLETKEMDGERNRCLYILKSRGMAHSNQIREFIMSDTGIQLQDVYIGSSGVLTGSSRITQEAVDQAETVARTQEVEMKQREIERLKTEAQAQIDAINARLKAQTDELEFVIKKEKTRDEILAKGTLAIARSRQQDMLSPELGSTGKTGKGGGR